MLNILDHYMMIILKQLILMNLKKTHQNFRFGITFDELQI